MGKQGESEPLSPLAEGAVVMHEMFLGLVAGGFTELQAAMIVAALVDLRSQDSSE